MLSVWENKCILARDGTGQIGDESQEGAVSQRVFAVRVRCQNKEQCNEKLVSSFLVPLQITEHIISFGQYMCNFKYDLCCLSFWGI